MRIKFKSSDSLPTDNIINMHLITIIIRSVFAQNGKFYHQLFLDDALNDVQKCLHNMKRLLMMKELTI